MTLKKLTLMTVCGIGLLAATTQTSQACCLFDWLFCCQRPTTCCFPPPTCCPTPCCPSSCGSCSAGFGSSSCGSCGTGSCGTGCSSCGTTFAAPAGGEAQPAQIPSTYGAQYAPRGGYWGQAPSPRFAPVSPVGQGFFGAWSARPVAVRQLSPAPVQAAQPEPVSRHVDRQSEMGAHSLRLLSRQELFFADAEPTSGLTTAIVSPLFSLMTGWPVQPPSRASRQATSKPCRCSRARQESASASFSNRSRSGSQRSFRPRRIEIFARWQVLTLRC